MGRCVLIPKQYIPTQQHWGQGVSQTDGLTFALYCAFQLRQCDAGHHLLTHIAPIEYWRGGAVVVDGLVSGYGPNNCTTDTVNTGRCCGVLFRNNAVGRQHDFNVTGRQGGGY